ncbi:hypothetical protein [Rheinheimera fenheensis]|uniref:hypothetical protein n=1 Tax=Rheinheimera fenheensis TaxID=3152295 RepID=UPI00326031C6
MNSRNLRKTTLSTAKLLPLLLLAGCGSTTTGTAPLTLTASEQHNVSAQPAHLQPLLQKYYQEGARNEVLNRLEIGSAALYHGDLEQARLNFDSALVTIESTYANNENALQARSLWHEEGRKDFRGEPYERAMAYYYRGVIYLIDGEYDNARASFVNALMQDAFAEEEQNRSDFALMMFLAGWSAQKMGSPTLADDAWQELKAYFPDFEIPDPAHNILVLAETGASPRKLADGVGHYQLVYRRGKNFTEQQISLSSGGVSLAPQPIEDIYFQASSRGGRPVDAIIQGKAQFRTVNAEMGSVLADLGTATRVYSPLIGGSSGQVSNALALVGVAQLMLASNTVPRADTRYWKRLPDRVHLTSLQANAAQFQPQMPWQASYQDADGNPVAIKPGVTHTFVGKDNNVIIWHKSREL